MVRQYAAQQQERLNQIQAAKDAAEEARETIFRKLEAEEMARRAEKEFRENLRTDLDMAEREEAQRAKEE